MIDEPAVREADRAARAPPPAPRATAVEPQRRRASTQVALAVGAAVGDRVAPSPERARLDTPRRSRCRRARTPQPPSSLSGAGRGVHDLASSPSQLSSSARVPRSRGPRARRGPRSGRGSPAAIEAGSAGSIATPSPSARPAPASPPGGGQRIGSPAAMRGRSRWAARTEVRRDGQ